MLLTVYKIIISDSFQRNSLHFRIKLSRIPKTIFTSYSTRQNFFGVIPLMEKHVRVPYYGSVVKTTPCLCANSTIQPTTISHSFTP